MVSKLFTFLDEKKKLLEEGEEIQKIVIVQRSGSNVKVSRFNVSLVHFTRSFYERENNISLGERFSSSLVLLLLL